MDTTSQKLTTPLVSITMITRDRAKYISRAIESVFAQTYANWELILIDDGSIDETSAIISHFNDARIRYIRHQKSRGITDRRNEALQEAGGVYIAVLDSDDEWISPKKLAEQVSYMETRPECVLVGTFIRRIDARGNDLGTTTYNEDDLSIRQNILLRNQFTHSSVLMRKSAIGKTRGYQHTLAEDLDLFLQLGAYGTFGNIPKFMTAYRIHADGASAKRMNMANAVHAIIHTHKNEYPRFFQALLKSYLRRVLTYCTIL